MVMSKQYTFASQAGGFSSYLLRAHEGLFMILKNKYGSRDF